MPLANLSLEEINLSSVVDLFETKHNDNEDKDKDEDESEDEDEDEDFENSDDKVLYYRKSIIYFDIQSITLFFDFRSGRS